MVAVTLRIKFAVVLFSLVLLSCQDKIIITEYELVDGLDVSRYVRTNEYSGSISIMYIDDTTLKSKRHYSKGKKNGVHEGWWPNGQIKYLSLIHI